MGRNVTLDFSAGGGSDDEFLIGTITLEPTAVHEIGNRVVLPAPRATGINAGVGVLEDVAISPAGPEPAWAYRATVRDSISGKAQSWLVGVPTGTTAIPFKQLTKFTTTIPPQTTAGMMQNWADTTEANADRSELAAERAEAPTDLMNKNLIENSASLTAGALSAAFVSSTVLTGPGIDLTGATDSTAGIRARINQGLAAGIKKFDGVPGAKYKIQIDGTTHRSNLAWFTDTDDVQIIGNGATLIDTTNYTVDKLCNIFGFTRSNNFEVSGWNYVGQAFANPTADLGNKGATFVYAEDNCRGIRVEVNGDNFRYGFRSGDYTNPVYGECHDISLKITGTMIGYAIAASLAYDVTGFVDVDGFHRASYLAGVTGARIVARHKNQYGATIANVATNAITVWADNASYANRRARGCKNIRVDSTDTGSTVFLTQSMCCGVSLQWVAQGTEFSDIEMTFHVRSSNTVASTVGGFQMESTVTLVRPEYPFNWENFITITGLRVRGDIDRSGQTVATNSLGEIFMRTYDSGDTALTHIPVVSKVDVQATYKKGSIQTRPWFMELPGLIDTAVLDRVQAPGVSLIMSAPAGVITARGGAWGAFSVAPSPHTVATLELSSGVVTAGVSDDRITSQRIVGASSGWTTAITESVQTTLPTNGTSKVTGTGWLKRGWMVKGLNVRFSYAGAPAGTLQVGTPDNPTKFTSQAMISGVNRVWGGVGLPYYPTVDTDLVVTFIPNDGVTYPNGPLAQIAVYAERFSINN